RPASIEDRFVVLRGAGALAAVYEAVLLAGAKAQDGREVTRIRGGETRELERDDEVLVRAGRKGVSKSHARRLADLGVDRRARVVGLIAAVACAECLLL